MAAVSREIYEFDGFRLDVGEHFLVQVVTGERIQLAEKAFETLCVLVRHAGRLVLKDELFDQVWAGSFVEENNLNKCIHTVRRALDEKRGEREFIETVKKHGFRFVAEVRKVDDENASNGVRPGPHAPSTLRVLRDFPRLVKGGGHGAATVLALADIEPEIANEHALEKLVVHPSRSRHEPVPETEPVEYVERPPSRLYVTAVAALLLATVVMATAVYRYFDIGPSSNPLGPARLAVLPLKPVDEEGRDRRLEFAIADSLILKISESKGFSVRQLSAVRRFVDLDEDPIAAGRELDVDYVLASNYQVLEGRIRVTSHLLNVRNGITEQTFRSETNTGNLFTVQDTVSNEIGNAVFERFGRPASTYASKRGTESEEAFNLFYEALYFMDKNSKEDAAKAADLLGQAVELDPNYAQAWALRAQAYCYYAHHGGGLPDQMFTLAQPMLDKALALDSDNCVAFVVRGTINRDYHWNFPQAYNDLNRAIQADPYYNVARRILAGLYYRDRRFDDALAEQRKAVEIVPTSVTDRLFLARYLVAVGRKDEGLSHFNRVAEMDPSFAAVYDSLWRFYHLEGEQQKAYENFIKLKEVVGTDRDTINRYKIAYDSAGWMSVLRVELEIAGKRDQRGQYSSSKYDLAMLASLVGKKDLAFEYLEDAFRFRHFAISYLKVDPMMNGLRGDPRFADLLRRSGLSS